MRIYLAARYSRRLELCGYREQLQQLGHTVQSRWLDGDHELVSLADNGPRAASLRRRWALMDFRDLACAELLIAFTEEPKAEPSRGGRHVELGIALGQMKPVWIVGPRENVFCWLEDMRQFDTWEQAKSYLPR